MIHFRIGRKMSSFTFWWGINPKPQIAFRNPWALLIRQNILADKPDHYLHFMVSHEMEQQACNLLIYLELLYCLEQSWKLRRACEHVNTWECEASKHVLWRYVFTLHKFWAYALSLWQGSPFISGDTQWNSGIKTILLLFLFSGFFHPYLVG